MNFHVIFGVDEMWNEKMMKNSLVAVVVCIICICMSYVFSFSWYAEAMLCESIYKSMKMNQIKSFRFYDTSYFDLKIFISENIFIFLRLLQKKVWRWASLSHFLLILVSTTVSYVAQKALSSDTQIWMWCVAGTIRPAALVLFISLLPHT